MVCDRPNRKYYDDNALFVSEVALLVFPTKKQRRLFIVYQCFMVNDNVALKSKKRQVFW